MQDFLNGTVTVPNWILLVFPLVVLWLAAKK